MPPCAMPAQPWNLLGPSYSAPEPSGPAAKTRRKPSMLSWPQPKQCPSKWTSIPIPSAAAVPAARDVLRGCLTAGGVGQGRVDRAGLLVAIHRERDLVALPALPDLDR